MKLSQFNNAIALKDKFLLYNALSNRYLVVEPLLNELVESARLNGNIDELLDYHPGFYQSLHKNGFIVENETDEIEVVKQMRQQVDIEDDTQYQLVINPTMNCNFKCWYCYESHEKGSKMDTPTIENVKKHITHVVESMPRLKNFHISWFGGEPLLYFEQVIVPVMEYVKTLFAHRTVSFSTGFTTNGFLINPSMFDAFQSYHITNFQITLDGNKKLHDAVRFVSARRGSYDDIIENVLSLCRNQLSVSIRINYTATNLKELEEIVHDLLPLEDDFRPYLRISFHKVWQEKDVTLIGRVRELHRFFRSQGFNTTFGDVDLPDTVRNSCYADKKNHATINYNGEVFKCTARNFSSGSKEGELNTDGSITWNEKYYNRLDVKFKNKPCLSCSILPICNGGCSQEAIEHLHEDYCMYDFDEQRKKGVILNKFLNMANTRVTANS
ncbi:uncharacterized protein SAMN05421788_11811 [Filimonas lacunae]|uniref:Radical SAM core domain-containing protein n=1 Tax=Filimonas lacunae TaxID=477680 RepID=A0A1N7RHK5_9BACT|nr:radical SAM protein [Filimonas lacunae]SIT34636.1 uncharacterized protein SAMN05421788_11811 [Filimonas lacunae]